MSVACSTYAIGRSVWQEQLHQLGLAERSFKGLLGRYIVLPAANFAPGPFWNGSFLESAHFTSVGESPNPLPEGRTHCELCCGSPTFLQIFVPHVCSFLFTWYTVVGGYYWLSSRCLLLVERLGLRSLIIETLSTWKPEYPIKWEREWWMTYLKQWQRESR